MKLFIIIFFVTARSTGFFDDFTPHAMSSLKKGYFRIEISLSRIGSYSSGFGDRLDLVNFEVPNDSDF